MEKIKVLHISAAGPETGAGSASMKSHLSLLDKGVDSRVLYLKGYENIPEKTNSYANNTGRKLKRFIITSLDRAFLLIYRKKINFIFSPGLFGLSLRNHRLIKWADIVHLHWINHGFVQVSELNQIDKPIFWTMHDMWPITGGCHYSFGCDKFILSCGECPALGSTSPNDLSKKVLERKVRVLSVSKIRWIAISSWMQAMAQNSRLLRNQPIELIFSGIDSTIFKPTDKLKARQLLGLPKNKRIILIGAQDISAASKGIHFTINALNELDSDFLIVTFGNGKLDKNLLKQTVVNLGFISDLGKLTSLYNAADIFLTTSIAEAFGMTIAEAQFCGLPVVAFDSFGPKDIIEHMKTGYLAEMNLFDLIKGINHCLNLQFSKSYINNRAVKLFSISKSTQKYISLYKNSLNII